MISCFITQRFPFFPANFSLLSFRHSTWYSKTWTHFSLWIKSADRLSTFSFSWFFSLPISSKFLFRSFTVSSSPSPTPNDRVDCENRLFPGATLSSKSPSRTSLLWSRFRLPLHSQFLSCARALPLAWLVLLSHGPTRSPRVAADWNKTATSCTASSNSGDKSPLFVIFGKLITVPLRWFTYCSFTEFWATKYNLELLHRRLETFVRYD